MRRRWLLSLVLLLVSSLAVAQESTPLVVESPPTEPAASDQGESVESSTTGPLQLEVDAPLTPEAGPELFIEANAAYEDGSYGRAVDLYKTLVDAGYGSGLLYYNLGNAYLRNGELGRSIASYRRGQLLRPRDEDLRANLTFARKTTQDALAPPSPSPVVSKLFFWHYGLSLTELKWATLVLNLVLWALLGARLLKPGSETLRWLTLVVLVPLAAVAVSLAVRVIDPPRVAVVVPQEINAQSGPEQDAVVRFKLHAGTEVRLRDQRDGWLRISLPDGQQGWIESQYAVIVEG